MKNNKFIGTGVALITPFDELNNVDDDSLNKLIENSIRNGVNYFVVLGTTAESTSLSIKEQNDIINFVIKIVNKRVPIVLGLGGNNTSKILERINEINFDEIAAILSVSPYYNKPTQEGIYKHYSKIAERSPVDIILYNVPGRTSSNIEPLTVKKLAEKYANIIGIKEASGDLCQSMQIKEYLPNDFLIISGDDKMTFPIIMLGGHGVISVQAMAFPEIFSLMVKHSLNKNIIEARKLHYKLLYSVDMFYIEGNPTGIKQGLFFLDIIKTNKLRLPLVEMSSKNSQILNKLIKKTLIDS